MATVAICTYNRADCLASCVESVFAQVADFDYEVLVVDNNSTDGTRGLVAELQREFPDLRYVLEKKQGLSYARNRALAESEADIVVFIDDDGVAQPGWLANLVAAFEDDKVAVAGGRVDLEYPVRRPEWLTDKMEGFLSRLDKGEMTSPVEDVYGCNYAVRREIAVSLGGFSTNLGFSGSGLLPGEDTELCFRVRRNGLVVLYVGKALVRHHVQQARLTKHWFRTRQRGGLLVSNALNESPPNHSEALAGYMYTTAMIVARCVRGQSDGSFWLVLERDAYAFALGKSDNSPLRVRSILLTMALVPRFLKWFVAGLRDVGSASA